MTLVFGGAYQGKRAYPKMEYGAEALLEDYHLLVRDQIQQGIDPCDYLETHWDDLKDKVIICDDISCGVVPMDPLQRRWREELGRCMGMLSHKAETVVRVFCGIGMKLK